MKAAIVVGDLARVADGCGPEHAVEDFLELADVA
jgi:hypothetical protein